MVVEIRLFATLREGRFRNKQIQFPGEALLGDLLENLKIPQEQVGILLVNGRTATAQSKLAEDDVVSIFPPIGGG